MHHDLLEAIDKALGSRVYLRRRDFAEIFGVSESQVIKWERAGVITAIEVPGQRSQRLTADQARNLARNIANGKLTTDPVA